MDVCSSSVGSPPQQEHCFKSLIKPAGKWHTELWGEVGRASTSPEEGILTQQRKEARGRRLMTANVSVSPLALGLTPHELAGSLQHKIIQACRNLTWAVHRLVRVEWGRPRANTSDSRNGALSIGWRVLGNQQHAVSSQFIFSRLLAQREHFGTEIEKFPLR